MGQVGLLEGAFQFLLHTTMVIVALGLIPRRHRKPSRWQLLWLPLVTFAASFAAHILAFILLKAVLGDDIDPWIHRPVVALCWGTATGLVFYAYSRPRVRPSAIAALLTAIGYLVFVLTRGFI